MVYRLIEILNESFSVWIKDEQIRTQFTLCILMCCCFFPSIIYVMAKGVNVVLITFACVLILCTGGGKSQKLSCARGRFWNSEKQECQKCAIGSYQDMSGDYNITECKKCPNYTTTWIEGATFLSYCRVDCPLGTEYDFQHNNCSLCPVGQFRDATLKFCYVCPQGFTTINQGSAECVRTSATLPGIGVIDISVRLTFDLGRCENVNHVSSAVWFNVVFLLRRQGARYASLCASDSCDNIKVSIQTVCNATEGAMAEIDAPGIFTILYDRTESKFRNSLSVILEAFYDMTVINDSLANPPYCDAGHILKADGSCETCLAGTFSNVNSFRCELCSKDHYSASPVNNFCLRCPPSTETEHEGSSSIKDCKEKTTQNIILIASCAGGAALLCVIVIVIVVVCWKQRRSRTSRDGSTTTTPSKLSHQNLDNHKTNSNPYVDSRLQKKNRGGHHENPAISVVDYNSPSRRGWDNTSVHYYKSPELEPSADYMIPAANPDEEEIYDEIRD